MVLGGTQQPNRHCTQLQHQPPLTNGTPSPAESRLASTLQLAPSAPPFSRSYPSAASDNDAPANVNTQPILKSSKPSEPKPPPTGWRTRIQTHSPTAHPPRQSSSARIVQSAIPRADLLASAVLLQAITPPIPCRRCHYHLLTEWAASRALAQEDSTALATAASPPTVV